MNISDPQSRKEIDALANEIKAIANSMYLEFANSESNPSHLQIQFTPQNPLQPTHSDSIPIRYTTSYEPSIDINNIQSATPNLNDNHHPDLTPKNFIKDLNIESTTQNVNDNHHPDLTPKNFIKDLNIESYPKAPETTNIAAIYQSELPKSSNPQGDVVSELEKLHSKIDGLLQQTVSPSKGNEYSFQQHQLYSPKTKEFQTSLTVNTNFENLKSSPSAHDLLSSYRNAQATPISDLQDKNVAISFVQEKRTTWTPSPTPYDNIITPKTLTERTLTSSVPSQNVNVVVSPTKKQGFDRNKLDNILQNINKRKQNSPIAITTNIIASPTHSLSHSKSIQDIFFISSGHQPASATHADTKNFVSFGAHKYNYDSSAALNTSYQTPSQIGRDFAQLKIDSVKVNPNDTLITPTPFRVDTAELSKKSASPGVDSAGHRRIKSGIAQYPYSTPTQGYYSSTSNPIVTDYRLSTDPRITTSHERNKSLHFGQSPSHLASLPQAQMQKILENEEKLDRILGKSLNNSKSVNFIKRLPDTTGEQTFSNASPTKPNPSQLNELERPFRSVAEGSKRTTFGSVSPNKFYGERGTVKQEVSLKLKSPRRFMNKTENVVV